MRLAYHDFCSTRISTRIQWCPTRTIKDLAVLRSLVKLLKVLNRADLGSWRSTAPSTQWLSPGSKSSGEDAAGRGVGEG